MATKKVYTLLAAIRCTVNRLYGHILGSSENRIEVSCYVVHRWHEASM